MQAVMIVLPVLALAAMGTWGLVEMRRGIWERTREEARRLCVVRHEAVRGIMEQSLAQSTAPRLFDDPPRPGGSGMTAGGLPKKVITAFAEWKKQPEAVSAAKMHALTLDEHPSVITTEIMHTVDPADHTGWKAKWRRIEHAQAFLRSGGFPAEGVRQMETRTDALGAVWLLGPPRQLQNIDELNDRIELSSRFPSNPCQLYVSIGREAEKHLLMPGEVLATYGTLPVVTAIAEPADMDALFAFQHRLTLGFVALMAVSVFSAMWGLVSLRRTVLQQQALSELKTNFIASVTHELRAPVASMQLLAEGLQNGSVSTEAKRGEYFRLIVEECRRLGGLIANVLDISRIERGSRRFEFEETDLRSLVLDTVNLHAPRAASQQLTLCADATEIAAQTDASAIQQALTNLLDNALKFAPRGSEVLVTLKRASDTHWRLSVLDHGPGVPVESRERIFEPFFRVGSELRRETQGTGIGLSIVRHIAQAHEGRVWVECADASTHFHFECPIEDLKSKT